MTLELTDRQWEHVAYSTVVDLIGQALDSDGLDMVNFEDYLPPGVLVSDENEQQFMDTVREKIGKVLSDLEEEAAKRDG